MTLDNQPITRGQTLYLLRPDTKKPVSCTVMDTMPHVGAVKVQFSTGGTRMKIDWFPLAYLSRSKPVEQPK